MRNRKTGMRLFIALLLTGLFATVQSRAQETTNEEKKDLYLRGMDEWGLYCANCHNATPPSDRAPQEWDTIMQHMRVRANMPAESARAILEYLRTR
jgi:hypothetical protein